MRLSCPHFTRLSDSIKWSFFVSHFWPAFFFWIPFRVIDLPGADAPPVLAPPCNPQDPLPRPWLLQRSCVYVSTCSGGPERIWIWGIFRGQVNPWRSPSRSSGQFPQIQAKLVFGRIYCALDSFRASKQVFRPLLKPPTAAWRRTLNTRNDAAILVPSSAQWLRALDSGLSSIFDVSLSLNWFMPSWWCTCERLGFDLDSFHSLQSWIIHQECFTVLKA